MFNYLYSYLMSKKELYLVPETEVLELRLEGCILTLSDPSDPTYSGLGEESDF